MKLLDSKTNKMLCYIQHNNLIIPFMTAVLNNNQDYAILPTTVWDIQKEGERYELSFEDIPEPLEMDSNPRLDDIMSLSPEQYVTNTRVVIFSHPDDTYSISIIVLDKDFPTDQLEMELTNRMELEIIKDCLQTLHLDSPDKVDHFIKEGQKLSERYMKMLREGTYTKVMYMQDEVD